MTASPYFSGTGLVFSATGPGVAIDPLTGALTLRTDLPQDGAEVIITAANAAGAVTGRFRLNVRLEALPLPAPVAAGRLGAVVLEQGAAAAEVAAAADFTGAGLVFAAQGGGAVIDAATGVLTLSSAALRWEEPVVVSATNSGGTAVSVLRLTVAAAPVAVLAPVAVGRLPDPVLAQGPGAATVSGQAGFAGTGLVYALIEGPAGASVHPASGLVTLPTDMRLEAAPVRLRASNAAGAAEQAFVVSVRARSSVFDMPGRLADVEFAFDPVLPSWTLQPGGFARLVPPTKSRSHSRWSGAEGDGRYRVLARWSTANPEAIGARPFSFNLRLVQSGADFAGLRVDAAQPGAGQRALQVHQYGGAGAGTATTLLGWRMVGWDWGQWTWVEMELDGASLRARLYPEGTAAPDWQVTVAVAAPAPGDLAPGAFGPGGFPRFSVSPEIDIRQLEFQPLAHAIESIPPAALDADWSLGQFTEQK